MRQFLIIVCCCFCSCTTSSNDEIYVASLPQEYEKLQRHVVGQLSGNQPLENGEFIKARWSETERYLTRDYLKQLVAVLDIEPKLQPYVLPNINPFVDLIFEPFKGTNVYGILPATQPTNDYIVLGAHYDTGRPGAPGAVDNATGMTLIYTVANQIQRLTHRNKNLVIVFFDQEEEENVGSKAFIELIESNAWNVHSVHCFDMVGWDGDHNNEFEVYSPSNSLIELYKTAANDFGKPLDIITVNPEGYDANSTDFDEFVKTGFNVIGGSECVYKGDYSPYKDTVKDTFDTVDFKYLWSNTQLVYRVITTLITE